MEKVVYYKRIDLKYAGRGYKDSDTGDQVLDVKWNAWLRPRHYLDGT